MENHEIIETIKVLSILIDSLQRSGRTATIDIVIKKITELVEKLT